MNNKRNMKNLNYKEKLSNSTLTLSPRQRRHFDDSLFVSLPNGELPKECYKMNLYAIYFKF